IRPEHALVTLGDHREAPALRRVNRALEIDAAPRIDHEPVAADAVAVDRDFGPAPQRSVVTKPEDVHLSGPGNHMAGVELVCRAAIDADYLDAEISHSHAPPSGV